MTELQEIYASILDNGNLKDDMKIEGNGVKYLTDKFFGSLADTTIAALYKEGKIKNEDLNTVVQNIDEFSLQNACNKYVATSKDIKQDDISFVDKGKKVVDVSKYKDDKAVKESSKSYENVYLKEITHLTGKSKTEDVSADSKDDNVNFKYSIFDKYGLRKNKVIDPWDFGREQAEKLIQKIEGAELNILTIGPKMLLGLLKGVTTARALYNGWKKKKSDISKLLNDTLKDFKKNYTEKDIPQSEEEAKKGKSKELTNKIVNVSNEVLTYIFKQASGVACLFEKDKFAEINENKFTEYKEGNITKLQNYNLLMNGAIEEYNKFYKEIIKKSKLWQSYSVVSEKSVNTQIKELSKCAPELENYAKEIEFAEESDKNSLNIASKLVNEYSNMFGKDKKGKLNHNTFFNVINKFNSTIKNIIPNVIDEAEISKQPKNSPNFIKGASQNNTELGEKTEQNTDDTTKQAEQAVDTLGKEILELKKHIKDKDIISHYEKLKKDLKDTDDKIEKWLVNHNDRENVYDEVMNELGPELTKQVIPLIWANHEILNRKKDYKESYKRNILLQLLNEKDSNKEQDEKVKKCEELFDKPKELIIIKDLDEFKKEYVKWENAVNELFKNLINSSNNEEITKELEEYNDKDPLLKICICMEKIKEFITENKNTKTENFKTTFIKYIKESMN